MVSTRPRINFVNGVCSACINFAERKKLIGNKEKKLFGNYVIKLEKKMVITMLLFLLVAEKTVHMLLGFLNINSK